MNIHIVIAAVTASILAAPCYGDTGTPTGKPDASLDLATRSGIDQVSGHWRYSDAALIDVAFRAAGPDGQPTGAPVTTYDIRPQAGWADFDDSDWPIIEPESLSKRRGNGRVSFNWYRIGVTIPDTVNGFDTLGATVVFQTSLDDYAEIWVDGELARAAGQNGGSVVGGWNATNRLVLTRYGRPGQRIQLAVFGMNGPISAAPTNFIYMHGARLDFYRDGSGPYAVPQQEVNVEVKRLDPALDAIVPPNPKLFKLAEGFQFIEGPVWLASGDLLFSDPNANRIYRYTSDGRLAVFRENSGYDGADVARYSQPGSNGLAVDRQGRLTIDEHGNRRVTRLMPNGQVDVLASAFRGKRLNSPNDLVYRSDGQLYFTDPPFGLPAYFDDPQKELPYSGVYRVVNGKVDLLSTELGGPNGLAFSPDEKYLYVANWDTQRKVVLRFPVRRDGALGNPETFFDMTGAPGDEALDGLKVDSAGNVFVSGPGGIWVLSPGGQHLGTIRTPRLPANFAWGGADGRSLYMTARSTLYRMDLSISGSPRSAAAGVLTIPAAN